MSELAPHKIEAALKEALAELRHVPADQLGALCDLVGGYTAYLRVFHGWETAPPPPQPGRTH